MKIKKIIKELLLFLSNQAIKLLLRHKKGGSIYYLLFSSQFDSETRAVLMGTLEHKNNQQIRSAVGLRRNIHRIEKGLVMEPRRDVFGSKYIEETINHLLHYKNNTLASQNTLTWAEDILNEYFKSIKKHTTETKKALESFKNMKPQKTEKGGKIPYRSDQRKTSQIDYDTFKELCEQRRSTRWFKNKDVDENEIQKAIEAASLAPSACNRQPYKFYITTHQSKASTISKLAMGTRGFYENIPCLIAVTGDLSFYPYERDRHLIYIDSSLASMQLMLALETLGLSSCPINWPEIEERDEKLKKALHLEHHEKVIMLIAVGYAKNSGGIPYSEKKESNELIKKIR